MSFVPRIEITGHFADSQALYDYLHGKIGEENPSEAIATLTESLCQGADNDIEKINRIAAWVRNNIRYVAIEHGEYGFRPAAADEVLQKRFGDCKGSANLIRIMLRSAGIDGRLVWIGTCGDVTGSWSENPSISAGNHMVAAAVLPDTTIFIDGTVSFAPAGLIPSSIAGQECMIENGASPLITHVPAQAPGLNRRVLNGTATLTSNPEVLKGDYSCEFTGQERVRLENILSSLTKAKRTGAMEILLGFKRKGIQIFSAVQSESEAPDAQSSVITYTEADQAGVRSLSAGKKYILLKPLRTAEFSKVDLRERKFPISLSRPQTFESNITFEIPENLSLESLPAPVAINSDWFEGSVDFYQSEDGKAVTCKAWLNVKKTDGDAASWNKAVDELETASNTPLIFKTN